MSDRSENSVLFALKELQDLEQARIASEAAAASEAEARRRREEREAEDRRRAEVDHANRVAEAEARLRVEAELAARDADAERRIQRMRAELDGIQRDRDELHLRMTAASARTAPEPRGGRGWALAFAASTLLAVGLGGGLLLQEPRVETVYLPTPAAPIAEATPAQVAAPPSPDVPAAAPAAPDVSPERDDRPRPRPTGTRPTRPARPDPRAAEDDPFGSWNADDDDPIGGITQMSRGRGR